MTHHTDTATPLVSIIIPIYNRAQIIGETLASIQKQTYPHWECLIVDDGSTDTTKEVVNQWIQKDNRFQFLERPVTKPKGANACRNYGLMQSRGSYVNFFDSDDLMLNDKLEADIKNIQKGKFDFTISQSIIFDSKTKAEIKNWNNSLYSDAPLDDFITKKIGWSPNAPIWKKNALEEANLLFDEKLQSGQDFLFHIEALLNNLKPTVNPERRVLVRDHQSKIEYTVVKAPSKAIINNRLLKLKDRLQPQTVEFLINQSLFILTALYKHKMWIKAVTYSIFLLTKLPKTRLLVELIRLFFWGTVYVLFGKGYTKLTVKKIEQGIITERYGFKKNN